MITQDGSIKMPYSGPYVVERIGDNGHTAMITKIDTNETRCSHIQHLKKATVEDPLCPIPTFNQTAAIIRKKRTPKNHDTNEEEDSDNLGIIQERNEDKPEQEEDEHRQTVDDEEIDTVHQLRRSKRLTNKIKS